MCPYKSTSFVQFRFMYITFSCISFTDIFSPRLKMETEECNMTTLVLATMTTGLDNGTEGYVSDPKTEQYKVVLQVVNILILVFLLISMGSAIDLKDFKETFRRPAGFFVGMVCQFILMPLIAFCLGLALKLDSAGALSLLIVACCPGGTLSNLFTYWTDGDVCLSVCMTSISTAVAIGMMPLNLFIYARVWTDETAVIPFVTIVTTLVSILIPVAFGVFIRWWKREWMKWVTRIGIIISFICIIIGFTLTFILNPSFLFAGWQMWLCAVFLPFLGFFLGYALARILCQSHRKCRTIAFETGSQNVALAMTLILLTFADTSLFLDMLFYPSLYSCFIYIDSFAVILPYKLGVYLRNRNKEKDNVQIEEPADKNPEDVKTDYENEGYD